jgi:hypothetical protein
VVLTNHFLIFSSLILICKKRFPAWPIPLLLSEICLNSPHTRNAGLLYGAGNVQTMNPWQMGAVSLASIQAL